MLTVNQTAPTFVAESTKGRIDLGELLGKKKIWGHSPGETIYELSHDGLKAEAKVVVEASKRR